MAAVALAVPADDCCCDAAVAAAAAAAEADAVCAADDECWLLVLLLLDDDVDDFLLLDDFDDGDDDMDFVAVDVGVLGFICETIEFKFNVKNQAKPWHQNFHRNQKWPRNNRKNETNNTRGHPIR